MLLGLRYRHVIALRRVRVVLICFLFIGASPGSIWMWRGSITFISNSARCSFAWQKLFYVTQGFSSNYDVKNLQIPQGQVNEREIPLNIARYKKISLQCVHAAGISYLPCSEAHFGRANRDWNRI